MARILIIDDDPIVLEMFAEVLEATEFSFELAESGGEGLRLLQQSAFDVVVTDILMPDIEGVELIIQLKDEYPKLKVAAMTGGGTMETSAILNMVEELEADASFAKPLDFEHILRTLRTLVA